MAVAFDRIPLDFARKGSTGSLERERSSTKIAWPKARLWAVEAPNWSARKSEIPMNTAQKSKPSNRAESPPTVRQSRKPTTSCRATAPAGGKTQKLIALLKRPAGASVDELRKASGWQAHSVRGFLAGTVKKRLGLQLQKSKDKKGVSRYQISG